MICCCTEAVVKLPLEFKILCISRFHSEPDSVFHYLKLPKNEKYSWGGKKIIFILQAASVACEEVLDILSPLLVTVGYSTGLEKVACNL